VLERVADFAGLERGKLGQMRAVIDPALRHFRAETTVTSVG